jgi:hypothetical protein
MHTAHILHALMLCVFPRMKIHIAIPTIKLATARNITTRDIGLLAAALITHVDDDGAIGFGFFANAVQLGGMDVLRSDARACGRVCACFRKDDQIK